MRGKKKRKAEAEAAMVASAAARPELSTSSKPPKPSKAPKASSASRRRAKGPARQTRLTRLVGLLFCAAGFAAIGLGWAGAANKDYVPGQMPYLLSGGALGLGLLVFGAAMMVMAQLRTEGRRLADRLESWRSSSLPPTAGAGTNGDASSAGEAVSTTSPLPAVPPELSRAGPDSRATIE